MTVTRTVRNLLAIVPSVVLGGCGLIDAPVLNPNGPTALAERDLMFTAIGLMLIVVIPVFVLTLWFARRYRASNKQADYRPDWAYSAKLDAVVWLVPTLIIAALAYLVWTYSHQLDPYRPTGAATAPLKIDVVAEDWKWLFIYPDQNIAVVNDLVLPAGRPVSLRLTSDTVMNAFYIPGLASQIYAMAGMRTELHLTADHPDTLTGRNAQYSGRGFADQTFQVHVMTAADFKDWVTVVKRSPRTLDARTYAALAKPSKDERITFYSGVEPKLFSRIIAKYKGEQTASRGKR